MPYCQYCRREFSEGAIGLHEDKLCPKRPTGAEESATISAPEAEQEQAGESLSHSLATGESQPAPVVTPNGRRIEVPGIDHNYVLPQSIIDKMERVERQSLGHPVRVLLLGHKGSGKTSLGIQYAAINKRPCYIAPCATMQEPQEWWGETRFTPERGTYYISSLFIEAVETPRAIVILDDADRVENPKVLNPLLPLLDDRERSWVEQIGRYVQVAQQVIFFATVNEGWEYSGSDPLDIALRDRFYEVRLDVPPEDVLTGVIAKKTSVSIGIASQLARFVTVARESATTPVLVSTRKILLAAEDVALGASIRDAVLYTVIPGLGPEEQEAILQILQQVMGESEIRHIEYGRWRSWDGSS